MANASLGWLRDSPPGESKVLPMRMVPVPVAPSASATPMVMRRPPGSAGVKVPLGLIRSPATPSITDQVRVRCWSSDRVAVNATDSPGSTLVPADVRL